MRALLLALAAGAATAAYAGPLQQPGTRAALLATAYPHDPDADAILAASGPPPQNSQAKALTAAVACHKSGNGTGNAVWKTKLGGLFNLAAWSQQAASVDWVRPSHTASFVNGPAFKVNAGVAGDGMASYADLNDTWNSAASLTSQDNVSYGAFTANSTASAPIGSMTTANLYVQLATGPVVNAKVNSSAISSLSASGTITHVAVSRASSATARIFANGSSLGDTSAVSSTGAGGTEISVDRRNTNSYGTARIAVAYYGLGLSNADEAVIDACERTYLTSIGAI